MPGKRYPSLRAAIIARVEERGLSLSELARLVEAAGGKASRPMLGYYLQGRYDLGSERVDVLMRVLGLEVRATGRKGRKGG